MQKSSTIKVEPAAQTTEADITNKVIECVEDLIRRDPDSGYRWAHGMVTSVWNDPEKYPNYIGRIQEAELLEEIFSGATSWEMEY